MTSENEIEIMYIMKSFEIRNTLYLDNVDIGQGVIQLLIGNLYIRGLNKGTL